MLRRLCVVAATCVVLGLATAGTASAVELPLSLTDLIGPGATIEVPPKLGDKLPGIGEVADDIALGAGSLIDGPDEAV
ncbi:hypothetical protein [Streptomyces klenkii]|uniref:hypothetical protein n=1 Tax=Streptomyces klenkii TaxID=1420899 RepID=UPI003424B08C